MARISAEEFVKLFEDARPIDDAMMSIWSIVCSLQESVVTLDKTKTKYHIAWKQFKIHKHYDIKYEEQAIKINPDLYYVMQLNHDTFTFKIYKKLWYSITDVQSYEDKKNFILAVVDKYYKHMTEDNAMIKDISKIADLMEEAFVTKYMS